MGDPSRDAIVETEADTEAIQQSGEKSGMFADENDTGERSNSHAISRKDKSLRICISIFRKIEL